MAHFQEFLDSDTGKAFTNALKTQNDLPLKDSLAGLYAATAKDLSKETIKPTYEPMLKGLFGFVVNGAILMKKYGAANRMPNPKVHAVTENPSPEEVLMVLANERGYHDTMFGTGRETVQSKSASEQALTVIGLVCNASEAAAEGKDELALKLLKDAVATGLRALEEAQQPGSIAEKAQQHYQEKMAVN